MKVLSCSRQKVVIEIIWSGWSPWKLLLHDRDEIRVDLIDFITSKQVRHFSRGEDVVDVLQESLVFDLVVSEEECDPLPPAPLPCDRAP